MARDKREPLRVGIVEFPMEVLFDHEEAWKYFKNLQLVPIKIDEHVYARIYHVFGISPFFDQIEPGEIAPHYDVIWTKGAEGEIHLVDVRKHGMMDA